MSDSRFLQNGAEKRLSHVIEEAGEVLVAAGKIQRFGFLSVNPLLPPEQQETNVDWLRREMADLRLALDRLEEALQNEFG